MITADEARAACLARGVRTPAQCAEIVASQMVGGVYCDGTIVITAEGKRCVPRAISDKVDEVRRASPLPAPVSSSSSSSTAPWLVVVGAVALVAFAISTR